MTEHPVKIAGRQHRKARSGTKPPVNAKTSPAPPLKAVLEACKPPDRFVIELNPRWRVTADAKQWILQRRKQRSKSSGWTGRSFCATRQALLRCIRDYCGIVDAAALAEVEQLPELHRDVR